MDKIFKSFFETLDKCFDTDKMLLKRIESLENSLNNRRQKIDGLIESFQKVRRELHKRIETLENKQKEL